MVRPPQKPAIDCHDKTQDDDEQHRQRRRQIGLEEDVAHDELTDADRHQVVITDGQRVGTRVRPHGVGVKNRKSPQKSGQQHRDRYLHPVLQTRRAHSARSLFPFRLQSGESRKKQKDTQRNLEVGVDEKKPFNAVNIEFFNDSSWFHVTGKARKRF